MPTRRELLKASAQVGMTIALPSAPFFARADGPSGIDVNDVQSKLNATRVHEIRAPRSIDDIEIALRKRSAKTGGERGGGTPCHGGPAVRQRHDAAGHHGLQSDREVRQGRRTDHGRGGDRVAGADRVSAGRAGRPE